MKKYFVVILLILFPSIVWSAEHTMPDCAYATIDNFINHGSTVDGKTFARNDTVVLPACEETTWTATLSITVGVTIQGNGIDSTNILYAGETITWTPDATAISSNEAFKITGITFNGNGASITGLITLTSTAAATLSNVIIGENKFKNTIYPGAIITTYGNFAGVIYSNQFIDTEVISGIFGSNATSWANRSVNYGTSDALFFEDNTISFTISGSDPIGYAESGQGGKIVYRYNTWDLTNTGNDELWDIHGLQSCPTCDQWSTLSAEFYGNMVTNYHANLYSWMVHRGSWLMMFNNTITGGTAGEPWVQIHEFACDDCTEATSAYSMRVQNTYVFNNTVNNKRSTMVVNIDRCGNASDGLCDDCTIYAITENTDYWNYNPDPLDGSAEKGINCGSAAPTSNCSVGDGYWQTTYSPCSTPPASIADMRTYSQAGTFYKCNASGEWKPYYTPYTYPHPLRGTITISGGVSISGGTIQ